MDLAALRSFLVRAFGERYVHEGPTFLFVPQESEGHPRCLKYQTERPERGPATASTIEGPSPKPQPPNCQKDLGNAGPGSLQKNPLPCPHSTLLPWAKKNDVEMKRSEHVNGFAI